MNRSRTLTLCVGAATAALSTAARADPLQAVPTESNQDLSGLSIEDLAQINVRSASRRDEPLSAAPTSVYVITGDAIQESAATSLPEALRLAPNLNVQRVDARQYAISARGFNSLQSGNKLLALMDGRTVYTPLAASIFWELHNRPLEDIAQIEVISGPGGTLYGPNAVNGIISVATRDAHETLGGLVRATVGTRERTAVARYGAPLGQTGAIRFYGSLYDREGLPAGLGGDINDDFRGWQGGFRADFEPAGGHLTVQGDVFDSDTSPMSGDGDSGHNLLARLTRNLGSGGSVRLQAYYDWFERDFMRTRDSLQTFDVQGEVNLSAGAHDLVFGGGIRTTRDRFINNQNSFQLDPPSRRLWVYNLFAQDRFALTDRLALIAGAKLEETSFTGLQLLPSLRLAWQPTRDHLVWGAVSRAIRTPSRIDRQLVSLPVLAPAPDFTSEKLVAFEAGYRGQPAPNVSLSVSVFVNLYDDIRSTEFSPGPALPVRLANGYSGETYGLEAWSSVQLRPWWRLNLGFTTLSKHVRMAPGRIDASQGDSLGDDPDFQLLARSDFELGDRLALDVGLRWVGEIDAAPGLPAYAEADARLAYRLSDSVELYVAGENLLHDSHAESNDAQRAQRVARGVYAGTRLRF